MPVGGGQVHNVLSQFLTCLEVDVQEEAQTDFCCELLQEIVDWHGVSAAHNNLVISTPTTYRLH